MRGKEFRRLRQDSVDSDCGSHSIEHLADSNWTHSTTSLVDCDKSAGEDVRLNARGYVVVDDVL
jgi:hypothetical protein